MITKETGMSPMDRREFLHGTLSGAGVVLLAPLVPGCGGPALPPASAPSAPGGRWPYGDLFGVTAEAAKKILARALEKGGDFAELYFEHTVSDGLKLEESRVNDVWVTASMGGGVRVVVGDQSGYAYTESLEEKTLLQAAGTASLIARTKAQGDPPDFKGIEIPSAYPVKTSPTEYAVDARLDLVRRVDKAARAASNLVGTVIAWHRSAYSRVLIFRSDGRVLWDARPRISLGCVVTVEKGDRSERNFFSQGGRLDQDFFNGDRPESIAAEAVRRAELSLEAVVPPAGEMPVVLGPGYSGILLHEAVGHGLEADFNRKKVSIYADRVGEKVASDLCTIVDDGTIQGCDGSVTIDDEGTPGHRTVLIEKGVLKGYMHDRISARHFKAEPTGNGRRESYRHQPIPRMTNTLLLGGPHAREEVFEGIEKGIYAVDFTNGQVNIGPGDYTFFVNYGYLIEKGKCTSPIKDVNIIGNGPESLTRVDRVADDMAVPESGAGYCGKSGQRVPVNYGVPHLRISKVTVGGKSAG
jgi:TldD protein